MNATSPRLIVVVGTGTEVGKTWVAVQLLTAARARGLTVAARKPAQSYAEGDATTDAALLAASSGEAPETVCPRHRWYPVPMAPPMAADALRREPILLADLIAELQWPTKVDLSILETAGGVCSPIAHDADNLRLIEQLNPNQVVLVADAGLGTLNSVRLCTRALVEFRTTVFLNRFDPTNDLHQRNREWLSERDGLEVVTDVMDVMKVM